MDNTQSTPLLYNVEPTSDYAITWPKATDRMTKALASALTSFLEALPYKQHPIISIGYNTTIAALKKGISTLIVLSAPTTASRALFDTIPPLCALHNTAVLVLTYDSYQLGALLNQHSALCFSINLHSSLEAVLAKQQLLPSFPTTFQKLVDIHHTFAQNPDHLAKYQRALHILTELTQHAHHFALPWITQHESTLKTALYTNLNDNARVSGLAGSSTETSNNNNNNNNNSNTTTHASPSLPQPLPSLISPNMPVQSTANQVAQPQKDMQTPSLLGTSKLNKNDAVASNPHTTSIIPQLVSTSSTATTTKVATKTITTTAPTEKKQSTNTPPPATTAKASPTPINPFAALLTQTTHKPKTTAEVGEFATKTTLSSAFSMKAEMSTKRGGQVTTPQPTQLTATKGKKAILSAKKL